MHAWISSRTRLKRAPHFLALGIGAACRDSLSFSVSQPLLPSERTRTSSSAADIGALEIAPRVSSRRASRSFGSPSAMAALRGFRGFRGFVEGGLRLLRDGRKRIRLIHGEIGKHLAIDFDLGLLQAVDDLAVAQPELARGGVDAGDPERAEVALLGAAIAVRILAGLDDGLLRSAEYLAAGVVVALRLAQNFLVTCEAVTPRLTRAMCVSPRLLGVGHQLVDAAHVALVHERGTARTQLALGLARLMTEIVAAASRIGLPSLRRFPKTFGRCPVGFQLRHYINSGVSWTHL